MDTVYFSQTRLKLLAYIAKMCWLGSKSWHAVEILNKLGRVDYLVVEPNLSLGFVLFKWHEILTPVRQLVVPTHLRRNQVDEVRSPFPTDSVPTDRRCSRRQIRRQQATRV